MAELLGRDLEVAIPAQVAGVAVLVAAAQGERLDVIDDDSEGGAPFGLAAFAQAIGPPQPAGALPLACAAAQPLDALGHLVDQDAVGLEDSIDEVDAGLQLPLDDDAGESDDGLVLALAIDGDRQLVGGNVLKQAIELAPVDRPAIDVVEFGQLHARVPCCSARTT
ncbi:MAG: hypothetical protein WCZ28_11330 [Burkholderiaceae bacterium]